MTITVQRWLKEKILALDSIRAVTINRVEFIDQPDLSAFTWSGSVIHIYLLREIIKSRLLKKIIHDNTRVGVGSLFLLRRDLAPDDGERLIPDETLVALHALFKDKIYTFSTENHQVKIGQLHFKSYGRGGDMETWYGPDVEIIHLPCYRIWVKNSRVIKGDWLIANFGTETFWKTADYSAGRSEFRRQQRMNNSANFSTGSWNQAGFGQNNTGYVEDEVPRQPNSSANRRLVVSYQQLGVSQGVSYEELKSAFRKRARELHPDVSTLPKEEAENQFKLLNEAYIFIKTTHGWG